MAWYRRAAISATGMLVALILVGAAVAGNANGNANGNGAEHAAQAPGQVKKDATPAQQSTPVAAAPAPAAAVSQPTALPAAAPAAADPGVKPSNDTSKNTSCVTGQGSGGNAACGGGSKPDSSKQYGNGTTAAQIATSRGGNGVPLKGPGNSQPHKVVACGRRHAVDVHAVKHYDANACTGAPTSTPDPKPNPEPKADPTPGPTPNPTPPTDPGDPSSTPSPHEHITGGNIVPSVRVLGDPVQRTHNRSAKPPSAVLSEVAAGVPPALRGTLPFTGFPLWLVAVTAVGLIAMGIALRKRSASPERSKL